MKRLLVVRFSAMGDVAMTVPVLYSLATQYPELEITVLSRANFRPLFEKLPENVTFRAADLRGKHKGILGLTRLFRELRPYKFDAIADLHNVLRTRFLRTCFWLYGKKTASIQKGRKEKKQLVRSVNKIRKPLKTSFTRYEEVFPRLGLPLTLHFSSIYGEGKGNFELIRPLTGEKKQEKWVGIAPFAQHTGKIYPLPLMEKVVALLNAKSGIRLFFFGGGKKETEILQGWEKKFPGTFALPGKLKMPEELVLMSYLDVMISMDSANMHMASLVHTPVISIWGATHFWCGFMGWGQKEEQAIQMDLPCRPCSVFGNKPCLRKDYACLNGILPEKIVQETERLLKKNEEKDID